jgi:hypothetical protein
LSLSKDKAVEKLGTHVEWGKYVAVELAGAPNGELVGKRNGEVYTVARSIRYQNIYMPYARFHIDLTPNGSVANVTFYAPFSEFFLLFVAVASCAVTGAASLRGWLIFLSVIHLGGIFLFFLEKGRVSRKLRYIFEEA